MASDCVSPVASLREIERALRAPSNNMFIEEVTEEIENDSDLDEKELDQLQMEGKSANTLKQTVWGMKAFFDWLKRRKIMLDLSSTTASELAGILRKFYAEFRTKSNNLPTPSTLRSLRAAIHRTLRDPPYSREINIMQDKEFTGANSMFDARCKAYFTSGGKALKHKPCIEPGDMEKLSNYFGKSLSETDPTRLLEMVWFYLCFYFGRRGREGWRNLTKTTLVLKEDDKQMKYRTFANAEQTKNWQGSSSGSNQDYSDVRMYEQDSPNDPVSAYLMYLSKLNPNCDTLFQTPIKSFQKCGTWYHDSPMGKNTLANIMQNISKKASLSQIYTCHSVRASTITYLHHAGVDVKQICNITKHKSEESLNHYLAGSSSAQKRHANQVLHGVVASKRSASVAESHETTSTFQQMSYSCFDIGIGELLQPGSAVRQNLHILAGANVTNCTINFHVHN